MPIDDRQQERRQQAERKRPPDDFRDLLDLLVVAAERQHVAVRQRVHDQPHVLGLAIVAVEPHHRGVGRNVGRQAGRQALHVAGDAMAVGPEQGRDPDAPGIVMQSIVDALQLPRRRIGRDQARLAGEQIVVRRRHVGGGLPIDEGEQQEGAQHEGAGDAERPAERGGADEIRQAHGG